MTYDNITKAIFISRPNRFIAKVRLFDNQEGNARASGVEVLFLQCRVKADVLEIV